MIYEGVVHLRAAAELEKKTCGGKALKLYRKFSTATKNRLMSKCKFSLQ
jgi:hypothetical protein